MKIPANRKGFKPKVVEIKTEYVSTILVKKAEKLVYAQTKLSHSGITGWNKFEGFDRKMHNNSLSNLLYQKKGQKELITKYAEMWRKCSTDRIKKIVLEIAKEKLFSEEFEELLRIILNKRHLNVVQSRKIKSYANKLCYYSKVRSFKSKKNGSFNFKVGFLTLSAPESALESQILTAFDGFLDYLRRTAKCVYVWKKEIGEKGEKLHFHLIINNFLPYYIIEWKWKRLLIAQGVRWPKNEKGEDTKSHYRIELPRSKKLVAHYIAKYMSKAYELKKELGYIWGKSQVLEECKEMHFIENDIPKEEIIKLKSLCKTISDCFVTHICVNLLNVKQVAPVVYKEFVKQYIDFQERISLEQKFWYV